MATQLEPQSKPSPPVEDVRSARPYLLTRSPLKTLLRRTASIGTLVVIDLTGLVIGVYGALVLRSLIRHNGPVIGVVLVQAESRWRPRSRRARSTARPAPNSKYNSVPLNAEVK